MWAEATTGCLDEWAEATTGCLRDEVGSKTVFQIIMQNPDAPSVPTIQGNIYRFYAMGCRKPIYYAVLMSLVVVIQVVAPCAMAIAFFDNFIRSGKIQVVRFADGGYRDVHHVLLRVMRFSFFVCFAAKALDTLHSDQMTRHKLRHLLKLIDFNNEIAKVPRRAVRVNYMLGLLKAKGKFNGIAQVAFEEKWFRADFIINTLVVIVCCFDMWMSMVTSVDVKGVVFDALSLCFLFSLDDVASELGFLTDDDWPAASLGNRYAAEKMKLEEYTEGCLIKEENVVEDNTNSPARFAENSLTATLWKERQENKAFRHLRKGQVMVGITYQWDAAFEYLNRLLFCLFCIASLLLLFVDLIGDTAQTDV